MDELRDGWTDGWKDGWIDGGMNRCIDGWMDVDLVDIRPFRCIALIFQLMYC
jgi:hypothetical protein